MMLHLGILFYIISYCREECNGFKSIFHGNSIYFFEEKKYNRRYENRRNKKGIKNIKEPRRTGYGNFRHKLEDIIIIGFCT